MLRPFGKNHLTNLLYWDAFCAAFCVVFFAAALYLTPGPVLDLQPYQVMGCLFWYRTLYSLTTFPFLLARIPVVDKVLGHHRPTAYTRYGKCVPKRKIWPWYPMPPEETNLNRPTASSQGSFAEPGSPRSPRSPTTPSAGLA